jgi:hypothetical protein
VSISKIRFSLTRIPRILRACFAITDRRRWALNASEKPSWDERNILIGRLIPPNSSILDLGAGAQTLKTHAPSPKLYVPCDIVKSTPDCIVCDFNRNIYPPQDRSYDITICSGVLEYLSDPLAFLQRIRVYSNLFVLSYQPTTGTGDEKLSRLTNGFVNSLRRNELEDLLRKSGYRFECVAEWSAQLIYKMEREP